MSIYPVCFLQILKTTSRSIAVACVYATSSLSHAWAANNLGYQTKRAIGLGIYKAIGNYGFIAAIWIYPAIEALAFALDVLSSGNIWTLRTIDKRGDKKHGKQMPDANVDVTARACMDPSFIIFT